uniref:Ig-like domain-containing protein n=1 Tax=Sinocyclocheilus rhinocerous TaxID=307959 RepID=A0A673KFI6_9TELE
MSVCVFTVCVISVSLQVTVEGFIGGSVVLLCSSTENDLKLQDINVHWRDKDRRIVCDIVMGHYSQEFQDQRYKNRVETFPDEYLTGNVSIKLKNLEHTDAGKYTCLITPSSEPGNKTTDQENKEDTEADRKSLLWVYIVVPVILIGLIGLITSVIIFNKKKIKFSSASFSSVTT